MRSRVWVLMLRLGFPPSALLSPEERVFTALVTRPAAPLVAGGLRASPFYEGSARLLPA
jgi:hypothetical protein